MTLDEIRLELAMLKLTLNSDYGKYDFVNPAKKFDKIWERILELRQIERDMLAPSSEIRRPGE